MNVGIGIVAAQSLFREYLFQMLGNVSSAVRFRCNWSKDDSELFSRFLQGWYATEGVHFHSLVYSVSI